MKKLNAQGIDKGNPFSMVYGSEAMLLIEIGIYYYRVKFFE